MGAGDHPEKWVTPKRPLIAILCGLSDPEGPSGSARDSVPHAYARCVHRAGGAPLLVPAGLDAEAVTAVLDAAAGVIITGGVDVDPACFGQDPRRELGAVSPERDALDRAVVGHVMTRPELPVLGVCRGLQALNVFAGGTLVQDIPSQISGALKHSQQAPGWYGTHAIHVVAGTILAETVGAETLAVNSFHHQAVLDVAGGFVVAARSADGVVEALERTDARYCVGVQFHPELMAGKCDALRRLFERLVSEAGKGT